MKFRIWDGDSENWDEKDHLGSTTWGRTPCRENKETKFVLKVL